MTDSRARHSVWQRAWWWLRTGHASPPGHSYFFTWVRDPSPWSTPWRAWRVILQRRRVHAPPLFFIMLFALGSVVGLILQFTLGVAWWIPPVILVILAWLWFFASIWLGKGPIDSTPLREELFGVFKPEEARARWQARMRAEITATSLRFFGPTHLQHLTPDLGWSSSDETIESVTLNYVEHEKLEDRVHMVCIVQTFSGQSGEAGVRQEARSQLMSEALKLLHDSAPPHESEAEFQTRHEAIVHETLRKAEALQWSPTHILIEHEHVHAHTATSRGLTFTYADLGDEWVLVTEHPRAGEVVCLGVIHDREPLIDRMFAPWRG